MQVKNQSFGSISFKDNSVQGSSICRFNIQFFKLHWKIEFKVLLQFFRIKEKLLLGKNKKYDSNNVYACICYHCPDNTFFHPVHHCLKYWFEANLIANLLKNFQFISQYQIFFGSLNSGGTG
jgi:hypothetical protein